MKLKIRFKFKWLWWLVPAIMLIGGGLYLNRENNETSTYQVTPVNLTQTVRVTGKVKAANKVDLAFERTGRIVAVSAAVGERVVAGQTLVRLDNKDATKALAEAQTALASAELDLAKAVDPVARRLAEGRLAEARQDGLALLAKLYPNLSAILASLDTIYFQNDFQTDNNKNNLSYYARVVRIYNNSFDTTPLEAERAWREADQEFRSNFAIYQKLNLDSPAEEVETIIKSTHRLLQQVNALVKLGRNLVQFFQDKATADHWTSAKPELVASHATTLTDHLNLTNERLAALGVVVNTINTERNLATSDVLDNQSRQVAVERASDILNDAWRRLADYELRAPFAGRVTYQEARVGEVAPAGGRLVSLITEAAPVAEVNLPEVDIAKIKLANQAVVTLDAYGPLVRFAARVSAIDPAETIVDGVPTYKVTLLFDQADDRLLPGLTANLEIQTGERSQVLAVPLRAVKFEDGQATVLLRQNNQDAKIAVTTGLTSSDGQVEILSGLKAGDEVVLP